MAEDLVPETISSDLSPVEEIESRDAADINETLQSSILRLKLIGIMKQGDLEQLDDLINKNPDLKTDQNLIHLAVQIAPTNVIVHLVKELDLDVNSADANGNTPLHLAALYGRRDVALELLSLPQINDTLQNIQGRQPVELSKYPEVAEGMQIARAKYVEWAATQMKKYLTEENIPALEDLLSKPRAAALLDINGQDPDTGSTVLHDFVKAKNHKMVKFILDHGGDPFRRNRKGNLPIEFAKDEAMKKLLKNAAKEQRVVIPPSTSGSGGGVPSSISTSQTSDRFSIGSASMPPRGPTTQVSGPSADYKGLLGEPPSMKGYLKKWTNFAGGYKLRWFVLENGILSYYKRQDDTDRACRGSINLKEAQLHLDSSEKLRFEIIMKGSNTKFHLKANHPVETTRWVWSLSNAIQYAKDLERSKKRLSPINRSVSGGTSPPDKISGEAASIISTDSAVSKFANHRANRSIGGDDSDTIASLSGSIGRAGVAAPSTIITKQAGANNASTGWSNQANPSSSLIEDDLARCSDEEYEDEEDEEEDEELESNEDNFETIQRDWRDDQTSVLEDTIRLEIGAVEDVLKSLERGANEDKEHVSVGIRTLTESINNLKGYIDQYVKSSAKRDLLYRRRLEKSEVKERLWVQILRQMELEHEKIQGALHVALQKRKETSRLLKEAQLRSGEVTPGDEKNTENLDAEPSAYSSSSDFESSSDDEFFDAIGIGSNDNDEPTAEDTSSTAQSSDAATVKDTEEKNKQLQKNEKSLTRVQKEVYNKIQAEESFKGYEDPPRTKLKLDVDDRPKISLWGILKNLIGKDMTRMTLPVSFNECTNLLQRSAEDMEYTDLLDKAASVEDPGLRMAYVAAFAASSYSSTINRIAKPFNPILGETFEYCRPDMGYRMIAEQVSHHPPIGALLAESPRWDFYGESNVKSKFNGRSFDINPLGLWYVNLRPDENVKVEEELYSFRKVTSSVVGIITGSPVVDNYGDMEITNHTLGYKCLLKFKARGWRGSNAYEVKGSVMTPKGEAVWTVGGHWNDKIYAVKTNDEGSSNDAEKSSSSIASGNKRIQLWQLHERPPAPFNLTSFAITLNALPERLKAWIPRTDTRLRPDQRDMEEGRYDEASEDKIKVEEKQRAARREREQKGITYKPTWFTKTVHPVTGQVYYRPSGTYWQVRAHKEFDKVNIPDIF